jgi:L-asparaginase
MNKKIVILGTGGTIAGAACSGVARGYVAGAVSLAALLGPTMQRAGLRLQLDEVAQIDSKDLSEATMRALALRTQHWLQSEEVGAILITHGTDTLEESAYFLHSVVDARKPVIFVSAMRPATDPWPDGPRNISDALTVAQLPGARGVMSVAAGKIHSGRDVRKIHPTRIDAFGSGDAGCLGYVEDGRVRMVREWPVSGADHVEGVREALAEGVGAWPRVALLFSHAAVGADLPMLLAREGYAGLVVAGTGNASVHKDLEEGLHRAEAMGVCVIVTSRCGDGPASVQGRWTDDLITPLTAAKARLALQLRLLGMGRRASGTPYPEKINP